MTSPSLFYFDTSTDDETQGPNRPIDENINILAIISIEMSENVRVTAIFSEFQKNLDNEQELREVNNQQFLTPFFFCSPVYLSLYNYKTCTYW